MVLVCYMPKSFLATKEENVLTINKAERKEVIVFFPDGKMHCKALEVDDMEEFLARNVCSSCGYKGAIMWNKFCQMVTCHNCGTAFVEENRREKIQFT
jgi:hypothetical protein